METGAPVHTSSVSAQTERRMDAQAPLTAVYIHTVPAVPPPQFPQPALASPDPTALQLTMPPLYSKETLPFLTLHIAGGLQPGMSMTAAAPTARPKSAGKHLCPHCGRDCMKPSVLEKHLRCHTGERPYPCTVCGVSFKTQSNLYKHKRTQAHARLSSESEQSLDSMSSLTTSLSMEERGDEPAGLERDVPVAEKTPVVVNKVGQNERSQKTLENSQKCEDNPSTEKERPAPSPSRHLLLQRQEATLFSKQWESSTSSSKSQSHESTDSGFSESSDHYPSPGSLLPDHSMDSLAESTTEHLDDTTSQLQDHQEGKDTTKEHKSLEERISKLISENSAVVEDKHLENVRPRKTVLSKQGSIDLPMPYTYKDSFHFDMRINKMSNTQRTRKPGFYNSVPTQQSTAMDHAPLTRSNSLPFSVALLQPDISSSNSSYQRDYTLFRRGSAGQIHPTGFSIKSVNQQLSTHRPLVRQAAVDCNHATDALCKNSSVEEACTSSTQCNGESGDICGEPSKDRKFRRKKAQKFAYNKWYMYGGGTFKKLYDTDRGGENSAVKGMKSLPNPESEFSHNLQKRLSAGHNETAVVTSPNLARSATVQNLESYPARLQLMPSFNTQPSHIFATSAAQRLPLRRNLSLSLLPLSTIVSFAPNQNIDPNIRSEASNLVNVPPCPASQNQVHIPSDRKKQKTDDKPCPQETETKFASQLSSSICTMSQPNLSQMIQPKHTQVALFPVSTITTANAHVSNAPPVTSVSSTLQSSFMPKYQLKLPNACSSSLLHTKLAQNDSLSSTASIVNTLSSTKVDTITTWTYQNICSSTTSQFLPCTISQTSSQVNVSSPSTVVHQCPVADTKTTTSLRNSHALIQCSPFGTTMPLPTSNTKTKADLPFTSIHRTQSAPAAFTVLNQNQQQFSSQKSAPSPQVQSGQSNGSNVISNISPIACQVVPGQQAAPKVFHMQTADLQICFQILSDEQLALIEPQIEKQTDTSLLQTGQVDHTPNQVPKNMVESHDKESGQTETNQEVYKDIAKPLICNKSEKEQPTIHTTQAPAIHPHIQVNKVAKSCEGGEVSTAAQYEGAKSERIKIAEIKECFAAQKQISHAKSDRQNITDFALSSSNNEVTHCKGNLIEIQNEDVLSKSNNIPVTLNSSSGLDRSDCRANETSTRLVSPFPQIQVQNSQLISLPRSNPPHPTVTLSSPQQTKACSENVGLLNDSNLSHEACLESVVVTSVSSDIPLAAPRDVPAASTNIPHLSTGLLEGGSMVRLEPQTEGHTGVTEQSHGPLQTERDTDTYIQLENKAEDPRVKADSFPNSWISEHHLQHLSHTPSGMSIYPPQSSGSSPKVSSSPALPNNNDYCNNLPRPLLLNCYSSQESGMDHLQAQALCEANLNKLSVKEPDISNSQARCEEKIDQRLEDENCLVSAKRSHISELTKIYQSSAVFMNPMRQLEPFYSEHISRDEPQESLDATSKYPSLFGAGLSYTYQPGDPQSSAVRVVQTSVEQEDSSSDDEGKLIIEL